MIKNFDHITDELSDVEKFWLGLLMESLKKFGINNPITSDVFCKRFNLQIKIRVRDGLVKEEMYMLLTGVRFRKIVNYIRSKELLPVIATSKGYFVSYNKEVIKSQVESLEQRARSIQWSADGLKSWMRYEGQGKINFGG